MVVGLMEELVRQVAVVVVVAVAATAEPQGKIVLMMATFDGRHDWTIWTTSANDSAVR